MYDDALHLVDEAVQLDPSNNTLLLNKADFLSKKNKFNEAIKIVEKLYKENAENYAARTALVSYLNNALEIDMECGMTYYYSI